MPVPSSEGTAPAGTAPAEVQKEIQTETVFDAEKETERSKEAEHVL